MATKEPGYVYILTNPSFREDWVKIGMTQNKEQREFDNLILQYYVNNGFKELAANNLKTFISIKFNSMSDAKESLKMSPSDIRTHYFELQRRLYRA